MPDTAYQPKEIEVIYKETNSDIFDISSNSSDENAVDMCAKNIFLETLAKHANIPLVLSTSSVTNNDCTEDRSSADREDSGILDSDGEKKEAPLIEML